MSKFSRRQLLQFFGATAAMTAVAPQVSRVFTGVNPNIAEAVSLGFTPVRLPHPLPIYQQQPSFLPTTVGGQGQIMAAATDPSLGSYQIVDDVVVPPEFERYVIVAWGDRVFPNKDDYFGYNNDYTAFVPMTRSGKDDGYLWVNHEYVSYPFSALTAGNAELKAEGGAFSKVVGFDLPTEENLESLGEAAYNMGGSVVRIKRNGRGEFGVVRGDGKNRRYHLLSGLKLNGDRNLPMAWGRRSHQQGDNNYFIGTGPAATDVFSQSEDGLGNKIIGTAFNCSGGTTPWGTILSAEENFQGTVSEPVDADGLQLGYVEGIGETFGLVGEKYGWMVEVDLANPDVPGRKHTALGRFRHENIAFRVVTGQPLVAYMGDDRRGGHTWRYVSKGRVSNPTDPRNSQLFEDGRLEVAKFNADGTGEWIELRVDAPTNPNRPSDVASVEVKALGKAQKDGLVQLPKRAGVAGQTESGGALKVTLANETAIADYTGKTLADFYASQGAVLVDAFLAANLVGGTPSARPEDLEVDPNTGVVYIAYTDYIPGSDGYPDSRIFHTAKLDGAANAKQSSGGIYKIIEEKQDGASRSFRWDRLIQGGEAGAIDGSGFANVDNLMIDDQGGIWGVTDMSTSRQNGFKTGPEPAEREIDHSVTGKSDTLVGVFGNNWVMYIPTSGPDAGEVIPFAYGPMRCEVTGPTMVGNTLIAAVQHPGEDVPMGAGQQPLNRDIQMLNLQGQPFTQNRTVPLGSNWPSNIGYPLPGGRVDGGGPPRPSIIGIRPKNISSRSAPAAVPPAQMQQPAPVRALF